MTDARGRRGIRGLPAGVVALGFVSMAMDASSELIHSLLPVFLVSVLGAGAISVGVIDGIAEATASVGKVVSGVISDRVGRRRPLVLAGYGLAALSKPLFPLAQGAGAVFTARFVDRIGKGIRGAPRDALIADITPASMRGAAYGLRQSMDTAGAVIGPLAAVALMAALNDDIRAVMWLSIIPAVIAVILILTLVPEPEIAPRRTVRRLGLGRDDLRELSRPFWLVVVFAAVLTLARFSEAFLLLRAEDLGLAVRWVPVVLVVMNVTYTLSSYPFGRAADRMSRASLLATGIVLLIVADVLLAIGDRVWLALLGAAVWGVHMGATQGILSAMVADRAPDALRATAFGVFNLVSGAALLAASLLAGVLWEWAGPAWTFIAGGTFATLALGGLLVLPRRVRTA